MVTHTSGLPRQPINLLSLEHLVGYLSDGENFYQDLDSDGVLGYLTTFNAPLVREPRYSNIGYAILGYILKYQTRQPIEQLAAQKHLFSRLA